MLNKKFTCVILGIIIIFLFAGCSKGQKPEDALNTYISNWRKQDFASMYKSLSSTSKSAISEEDFINKYKNIYEGIVLSKLAIEPKYSKDIKPDKEGKLTVPFSITMETAAGTLNFNNQVVILKEKQDGKDAWTINWTPQMIFPQLKDQTDKIRVTTKQPKRGEIYDRDGKGLALNGSAVSIGIVPEMLGEDKGSKEQLAKVLDISVEDIDKKLNASWVEPEMFVPIATIPQGDSRVGDLMKIKGVTKQTVSARVYPFKEAAAQLTGYIGPITAEEYEKLKSKGYSDTDVIGKAGLEQIYEDRLKGENGCTIYVVDSEGKQKEVIADKKPKDGENIRITIDGALQKAIYSELKSDSGTSAAVNPKTGEVLALVSSPSYDPNLFALGVSKKQYDAWNNDPKKPLLNKFTSTYAPGSTFKPVTAAIALKTGSIKPEDEMEITGATWQKDASWGGKYVKRVSTKDTRVNLMDALVTSDNIYFARTALKIGADNFLNESKNLGFGEEIPFGYPHATSMLINSGTFKNDELLADTGYGQGEVSVTPLHLSLMYSMFVNNGSMIAPALEFQNDNPPAPKMWHENVISPEIADTILKDLIQVVESPSGTGKAAKISGLTIAGKTGTAELDKQSQGDTTGKENGWFVAFDAKNPTLMITMMVEDVQSGQGSHYVVPKVKKVLEQFAK